MGFNHQCQHIKIRLIRFAINKYEKWRAWKEYIPKKMRFPSLKT
jgi:hypothetical protein